MDNQSDRLIGSTGVSLAAVSKPCDFSPDHPVEASPGQAGFVSPSIASARLTDFHVEDFLQSDEQFFHFSGAALHPPRRATSMPHKGASIMRAEMNNQTPIDRATLIYVTAGTRDW